ncbi:MAG: hypothetical protein R2867_08300 [Caldilineaceae bacterium]
MTTIGLNNGILDQTSILFSRRNHLTVIDCESVQIERAPASIAPGAYAIMAVYSGVAQSLVGAGYNNRSPNVRQRRSCWHLPGKTRSLIAGVDPEIFATYGRRLEEPLRRRATHFYTEMAGGCGLPRGGPVIWPASANWWPSPGKARSKITRVAVHS